MINRVSRKESGYEERRKGVVWNDMVPDRYPEVIARPGSAAEVAELVRESSAANRRVAVRSGGHNWLATSLRDDATTIDLGVLNEVEVDVANKRATIGPGATHKILADEIAPRGLAFPIGHCPSVGLGGFLLAGGAGWNMHEWGPGSWNVLGADVVTADGAEIFIDDENHPELFWALRGSSAAFPGIVTRFHVRLFDLPVIRSRRLAFPSSHLTELVTWVASRIDRLPPGVEISVIARRPAGQEEEDPRAAIVVTGFGADDREARAKVDLGLMGLPNQDKAIVDPGFEEIQLNDLEGEGGWEEGLRYWADTCWVSRDYEQVGQAMNQAIDSAPSPYSRIVFAWGHMPSPDPRVAFTRFGDLTVNVYATWKEPGDDVANIDWVRESMLPLEPIKNGNYIGEVDLGATPDRILDCYPAEKWDRIQNIVAEYDPEARFHGFVDQD